MTRSALLTGLLAAALVLAGCSGDVEGTGNKGFVSVSGDGVIQLSAEQERDRPGTVEGETLEGTAVSLDDYAGKVVVINVWGSWCPPCRAEADDLAVAANELQPKGVVFLGINTRDDDRTKALRFEETYDVPYASLYDPSGRSLLAFRGTITPNAIPSTIVIDAEGRVAARYLGEISSARTLVDLVEDVQG